MSIKVFSTAAAIAFSLLFASVSLADVTTLTCNTSDAKACVSKEYSLKPEQTQNFDLVCEKPAKHYSSQLVYPTNDSIYCATEAINFTNKARYTCTNFTHIHDDKIQTYKLKWSCEK